MLNEFGEIERCYDKNREWEYLFLGGGWRAGKGDRNQDSLIDLINFERERERGGSDNQS